ncbi:MAG: hypothetical protein D6826_01450 [Alphaproteobacteria bacterium]|nr:MAG: hypothetical protein D6826_01450 [Alphaproteobacteria bacterium]
MPGVRGQGRGGGRSPCLPRHRGRTAGAGTCRAGGAGGARAADRRRQHRFTGARAGAGRRRCRCFHHRLGHLRRHLCARGRGPCGTRAGGSRRLPGYPGGGTVIVGIDVGTQSLKVVVCDDTLRVRGEAAQPYALHVPAPGWAEQDPHLWEAALGPAIAAALARAGVAPEAVCALGLAGQLDGCIGVDRSGRAVGPALIWMDRRAVAEIADVPAEEVRRRAGVVLDAGHMAAKIRWWKRHGPPGAVRYHQPVSYLVRRLSGVNRLDHAVASTTMLYGLEARDYDPVLLDFFAIARDELPPLAEAAAAAGPLTAEGARLTGLRKGIPVAVGTGDDFSNALGAGVIAPGTLVCCLGTAEVVGALHPRPLIDDAGLVETHAYVSGLHFIENPGWLSGGAVTWFLGAHALPDPAAMDACAARVPAGAGGVTFLPALSGAMAPEWVAAARGCYYGLSAAHGVGHMARAVLEGCAFAMRDVVERLRTMGVAVETVRLLGGGAASSLWAQIRADILGLPVEVPARSDTSPLGAALLAAVAAGRAPDVVTAAARLDTDADMRTVMPQAHARAACEAAYARYRRLFDALRGMFVEDA